MSTTRATTNSALLIAAALFIFAATAAKAGEATISGSGQLRAKGEGVAHCRGQGQVAFTLYGQGRLVVRNRLSVSITATGQGHPKADGPIIVYAGYNGTVKVTGSKIDCRFSGGPVALAARGRGVVYLKGHGRYWTNRKGPFQWTPAGKSLTLSAEQEAEADQADEQEDDEAAYYDQSRAVVEEFLVSDAYKLWAEKHPLAAKYLAEHGDLLAFLKKHPKAAAELFKHKKFLEWAKAHPQAAKFISTLRDYRAWLKAHPYLAKYLHNPLAWQHWLKNHPEAAKALKAAKYKQWQEFAEAHPAAAAALRKHDLAVRKRMDANHDGKVDPTERYNAWKRRADSNKDGKVDHRERKAAQERHKRWMRHTDRNRDGRIQPQERARNLLERRNRRGRP